MKISKNRIIKVLKKNIFCKGQSLGELVILLGIVAIVFSVMQIYMQRGLQGRVKDLTDAIIRTDPDTKTKLPLQPYTAKDSHSNSSTEITGTTTVETKSGGMVIKNINESTKSHSYSESTDKL